MPVPNLEIFQYVPEGMWDSIPGFEGKIVEDFWKDIFSPDAVMWWAIGWQSGDVVYYGWEQQNASSGMVMESGIVGELPGPPGPPGITAPELAELLQRVARLEQIVANLPEEAIST